MYTAIIGIVAAVVLIPFMVWLTILLFSRRAFRGRRDVVFNVWMLGFMFAGLIGGAFAVVLVSDTADSSTAHDTTKSAQRASETDGDVGGGTECCQLGSPIREIPGISVELEELDQLLIKASRPEELDTERFTSRILELCDYREEEVLEQLIYYYLHDSIRQLPKTSIRRLGILLIQSNARRFNISDETYLKSAIEHMDSVGEFARGFYHMSLSSRFGKGYPAGDWEVFEQEIENYIAEHEKVPCGLAVYMYKSDPDKATPIFARVYGASSERQKQVEDYVLRMSQLRYKVSQGEFRLESEAFQSASSLVSEMAGSGEWWVRAYATRKCIRFPEFRTASLRKLFAADSCKVVRELVSGLDSEDWTQPE